MRISEIGEFGLISRIAALINQKSYKATDSWKKLLIGIGDDTAAWKCSGDIELITTDIMVEDIHFDFSYTGWHDLGWKSIAINISDINSMGGKPQYALVSLALPGRYEVNDILEIYDGILEISNAFGITVAGGNISASEKFVINITLTGTSGSDMMTRSSARQGDLIAVFGYPGLSAAGRIALTQYMNIDAEAMQLFKNAHLRPSPVFTAGHLLATQGVKTAIDISDGLISDLTHICEASHVGAILHINDLPVHPLLKKYFDRESIKMILTGGEDYELMITADRDIMKSVTNTFDPAPTIIGEISADKPGQIVLLDAEGKPVHIDFGGWDHYKHSN